MRQHDLVVLRTETIALYEIIYPSAMSNTREQMIRPCQKTWYRK